MYFFTSYVKFSFFFFYLLPITISQAAKYVLLKINMQNLFLSCMPLLEENFFLDVYYSIYCSNVTFKTNVYWVICVHWVGPAPLSKVNMFIAINCISHALIYKLVYLNFVET